MFTQWRGRGLTETPSRHRDGWGGRRVWRRGCGVYLKEMQPRWYGACKVMWQAEALFCHGAAGSDVSLGTVF